VKQEICQVIAEGVELPELVVKKKSEGCYRPVKNRLSISEGMEIVCEKFRNVLPMPDVRICSNGVFVVPDKWVRKGIRVYGYSDKGYKEKLQDFHLPD